MLNISQSNQSTEQFQYLNAGRFAIQQSTKVNSIKGVYEYSQQKL